jgi:hypothetical protein
MAGGRLNTFSNFLVNHSAGFYNRLWLTVPVNIVITGFIAKQFSTTVTLELSRKKA